MTEPLTASATTPVRRRRPALVGALVVGVVAATLVAVLATRPPATVAEADSPLLGQPAPTVHGPAIGGGTVDLAAMRGGFVLVNFFAGWCTPCFTESPQLHSLSKRAHVVGVVFQDSTGSARGFLHRTGATWPAVADPSGDIALQYGVRAPPESYLVSPDGTVVAKVLGPVTSAQLGYLDSVMARVLRTGQ